MSRSAVARADRRRLTARRITRCALRLADQRGLAGFTMAELADEAGVSRRTLFNYFPSKVDAVLGPVPELPHDALRTFVAGGPQGDLVPDLRDLVDAVLEGEEIEREDLARRKRLLLADPRLLAATHERLLHVSQSVVDAVEQREGPGFDRVRARVAVALLAAVLDSALDEFLNDRTRRPLTHHVNEHLRHARELLG